MYFKEFPQFLYDFKYGNTTKTTVVTDITRNVRFRKEVLENVTLFDEYDIVDGETPEIVAEKIYGDPEYHWIIMLANQKHDYISDFPLSEQALVKHIVATYGAQRYAIRHYVNAGGFVVNSTATGAVSVTNDAFERTLNESKRRIKVISPQVISTILTQYKELL
jgi:predicted site-specific integrase-resolvase